MHVVQYQVGSCYAPDVVVQKAASRLGEPNYDLFGNNCEISPTGAKRVKRLLGRSMMQLEWLEV